MFVTYLVDQEPRVHLWALSLLDLCPLCPPDHLQKENRSSPLKAQHLDISSEMTEYKDKEDTNKNWIVL